MDKRLPLTLPEALLMFAIDEYSGVVRGASELRFGLAGAILIELSLHGRLVHTGRNLLVVDRLRTGDQLTDEVLSLMRREAAPRPVRSWLLRITRAIHDLLPRYLDRLVQAGIVRHERARALGLFTTDRYLPLMQGARYGMTEHLRLLALADAPAEPRELALLRLLEACGLLDTLLARSEIRLVRKQIATHTAAERLNWLIAIEVTSLRQDSAEFAYIVGMG